MAEQARRVPWLRRFGPWFVGVAILVVVVTQVPFADFGRAIKRGPHIKLALAEIVMTAASLAVDSFATWIGLLALRVRWAFSRVLAVRGATYLLLLINYALGQGGFGYYLYRGGMSAMRAVGSTLFLLGTSLAALIVLSFTVWAITGGIAANREMWWTLVGLMSAFAVYLVVIAIRIRFLARHEVLAPLFDAGLRGHALGVAGRMPHMVMLIVSYWVAMRVWGLDVPFTVALTLMPGVVLASVLPISPGGLGTAQVAMVYFFAPFAAGATSDDRAANVLAFGIVHFVYATAATALVGLICIPFARRTGLLDAERAPAPEVP